MYGGVHVHAVWTDLHLLPLQRSTASRCLELLPSFPPLISRRYISIFSFNQRHQ